MYVTSFSLAASEILSFSITFGILNIVCLGVCLLDPSWLGLFVFPGLECLFLSPAQGSFQLLDSKLSADLGDHGTPDLQKGAGTQLWAPLSFLLLY